MRFAASTIILCFTLAQHGIAAAERLQLDSEADKISYSLGHQLGTDLHQQGLQPETTVILRGIQDGIAGSEPLLSPEEMQALLGELKHKIVTSQQQEKIDALNARRLKREMARKEGKDFMAANAKKPGVKTLPSGLQYRVITPGKGDKPALTDTVTVNYRGTLLNGNEFDSTLEGSPESFTVEDVIPGLKEAMQLMQPGSKWEVVIPPELGFGRHGALEDQTLIYEIELLGTKPASKEQTAAQKGQAE